MELTFMQSSKKLFQYYKSLGDKAMAQLNENDLFTRPNEESNSIAIVVQHLYGNMLSRWTDFLNTDGEKESRNRDQEFEDWMKTKAEVMDAWEKGWKCLFDALDPLTENDQDKIVYIRNEGHTVQEAILRQIAHYSYHVGQIVFLAKALKGEGWQTLSIAKNASKDYNKVKFEGEKKEGFFTDRV
ncbi:MAG TPA: DUF1572 family protein [Saprospiraceae bacterium]|nr:DUF1572 family protein [Saprospiraceae bacterium]